MIVIVSSAVPPAKIALGANDLLINGLEAVTVSVSVAEQTPPVDAQEGLVFVTLIGGLIVATLITWVWARESDGNNKADKKATTIATQSRVSQPLICRRIALARIPDDFKDDTSIFP